VELSYVKDVGWVQGRLASQAKQEGDFSSIPNLRKGSRQ
jgi:hypothetical protein